MPRPIRALLFDVEGVIAQPDRAAADRGLAGLAAGLDSRAVHAARNRPETYPLWERYSTGCLTREAYWSAILEALEIPVEAEALEALLDIQAATCWARLDATLLARIAGLRGPRGPRLGLLSNSAPDHEPFIARFEADFDMAHFSHRTGRRKPQPEAYLAALEALGAPPEATLFVDDKPRNTEAAARLGLQVWHYTGREAFEGELHRLGLDDG
ncbi:MAG: HAD family phosphatase [Caldilineae bacterium]|nr:HAD family phosphatase [Chloroflexota bacterium]MCB9176358.1 HAD family phosphatase [Caldilineae bacterium]